MTRALIVSLSAPEMDRLAVELAARGALAGLVRRYTNKRRWWEQLLATVPLFGGAYAATLGRRLPPQGLSAAAIIEAASMPDFAAAVVNRAGRRSPAVATRISRRLLAMTERGVANAGSRHVHKADIIVASYHVAFPAFREARQRGLRTILNYPIAHHRWQYRYYAEQARRFPDFAPALPRFGQVEAHAAALDREIELADVILVGSSFVRDTFISEGIAADRLRVIPYGSDAQLFTPATAPKPAGDPFRVLFVGQIGERKGISHLLKAYRQFRKADSELHLVGDYVEGSEVYAEYQSLFRHTLNVPQTQLAALFRQADVFVFPTLVEGLGMVVLEAMASGLPVIVTPNGPGDVVRNGIDGFVVPVCDSEAICDRLEKLYADRLMRQRMARNAREQAEQWSWHRYSRAAADVVLAPAGKAA